MVLKREVDLANQRANAMHARFPRALAARYDRERGRIVISLSSDVELSVSACDVEGLSNATPAQLMTVEITPSGYGLHFPKIDADVYVPALIEGVLGSKRWMAARLGHAGGRSRSVAKRRASRANGKLGGRPRRRESRS
ncbi:MAG TPA: DUF2442 domain-containing protein [Candidatus Acidoferrales bacterium]|nr:DUF2442 domain-containing protein [Candidatus Acidoferrales bacterium]